MSKQDKPVKVLVLCHGNRWRSVTCLAALKDLDFTTKRLQLRSAGFAHPGKKPAHAILSYCQTQIGVDMGHHRSAIVTDDDLKWADVVIYMDGGNRKRLEAQTQNLPGFKARKLPLGQFHSPVALKRIRDPAFMATGSEEFRICLDQIKLSTFHLYHHLTAPKAKQQDLAL